eukprot:scaffold79068_cov28-Tisochrysis_lutea.AAC.1
MTTLQDEWFANRASFASRNKTASSFAPLCDYHHARAGGGRHAIRSAQFICIEPTLRVHAAAAACKSARKPSGKRTTQQRRDLRKEDTKAVSFPIARRWQVVQCMLFSFSFHLPSLSMREGGAHGHISLCYFALFGSSRRLLDLAFKNL